MPCPYSNDGLNKSILDFFRHVESGTRPDSTSTNQPPTRLIRARVVVTRGNPERVQSFHDVAQTAPERRSQRTGTVTRTHGDSDRT